jgi:predicted transcriptional regulator
LVYLCADKREVKRYDEIAKALNIGKDTVRNAVLALDNIEFSDMSIKRSLAWFKTQEGDFKVNG